MDAVISSGSKVKVREGGWNDLKWVEGEDGIGGCHDFISVKTEGGSMRME